jgi:hypothetical protein
VPATTLGQKVSTPVPKGVTAPTPVTTTRPEACGPGGIEDTDVELIEFLASQVGLAYFLGDVSNCIAYCLDFTDFFIGDIDSEFVFERHNEFYNVQRVCTKVIGETGLFSYIFWFDVEFLNGNLLYAIKNVVRHSRNNNTRHASSLV